jgi:hypothetical protein
VVIYELRGKEAKIDWATIPKTIRIALFINKNDAEREILKIKQNSEWYMDWDSFEIREITLK